MNKIKGRLSRLEYDVLMGRAQGDRDWAMFRDLFCCENHSSLKRLYFLLTSNTPPSMSRAEWEFISLAAMVAMNEAQFIEMEMRSQSEEFKSIAMKCDQDPPPPPAVASPITASCEPYGSAPATPSASPSNGRMLPWLFWIPMAIAWPCVLALVFGVNFVAEIRRVIRAAKRGAQ